MEFKLHIYDHEVLGDYISRVLQSYGVPKDAADRASGVLITSDLRGIDSHGIARLIQYAVAFDQGRVNPTPNVKVERDRSNSAVVSGDNGMGLVVAPIANDLAIEKALANDMSCVTVHGSNHYGIAGWYVLQAIEQGLIGMSMTNSSPAVALHNGLQRSFGTNPLALGIPTGSEPPVVVDMASSTVAYGKIEVAIRLKKNIPFGWGIDSEGNPTDDPNDIANGGAMLPLGSDDEGSAHKGQCFGTFVDFFVGPLAGANWGAFCPPFSASMNQPDRLVGDGLGHCVMAFNPEAFRERQDYLNSVDDWARTLRSSKAIPGKPKPVMPGDPERAAQETREVEGIPVPQPVVDDLLRISQQQNVALPEAKEITTLPLQA